MVAYTILNSSVIHPGKEDLVKKENRLRSKLLQFSYDHRKLKKELSRIRFSTNELCDMLDSMSLKTEKELKNKNN